VQSPYTNSIGQGPPWNYLHAGLLLAALYALKFLLVKRIRDRPAAAAFYAALAALSLPYIYAFVITDWSGYDFDLLACRVGVPALLLAVPTASFLLDLRAREPPPPAYYALRTAAEVFLLLPLWASIWICIELVFLGWIWM
jgi:hypothetical protein